MTESRKVKTYTPEFRESAVQLALNSNRPMAQTATELGLSKDTDCVAIFGKTFWDLRVTKRSQKLATSSAFGGPRSSCVRHAGVLRFATHAGTAPTMT